MNDLEKMLQLNIDDIEPMEVSPIKKKQVLRNIIKQKKRRPLRYAIAAALLACGIGASMAALSPTIASQIPIVKNVVDYFNGESTQFIYFDEYATVISSMETSNDTTIEIADAIYDGTNVTITLAIKSEKDLGKQPVFWNPIETNGIIEGGGVTSMKKVADKTYAAVMTITPDFKGRSPRTVKLSWTPGSLWDPDTDLIVEGDWSFKFKLKKIHVEKIHAGYSETKEEFSLKIPSIDVTGYTINVPFEIELPSKYSYFFLPGIELEAKDEFGNPYEMITNGGSSSNRQRDVEGSYTFANLQNGAEKLILTPKLITEKEEIQFEPFTVNIPEEYRK